MEGRLVVVPCGRKKIWDVDPTTGPVVARHAYVGPTFRINCAYAERFGDRWLILSAKYGFVDQDYVIPEAYDVTFKRRSSGPVTTERLREQVTALTDGHVWVANGGNYGNGGNSVTEVDASNGALVRVMSGPSYQLNWPTAIASDSIHVWVANTAGDSVTELDVSTGHLVGVNLVGRYPDAIASDGDHIWVASQSAAGADEGPPGSVTELDASTGNVVRMISDSSYQLNFPVAITSDGTHVWVANYYRKTVSGPYFNSVTEFSASTGRLIKVISGSSYEFNQPDSMASDGTHVWVVNNGGAAEAPNNSITELNAATGDLVRVMSASTYGLSGPESICLQGTHVWVANGDGQSVTEFPAG